MWCYRRMMNIKWMDRITNEDRIRDMGCETFREVKELLASGGDRDMGPPRVDGEQQNPSCPRVGLDRGVGGVFYNFAGVRVRGSSLFWQKKATLQT